MQTGEKAHGKVNQKLVLIFPHKTAISSSSQTDHSPQQAALSVQRVYRHIQPEHPSFLLVQSVLMLSEPQGRHGILRDLRPAVSLYCEAADVVGEQRWRKENKQGFVAEPLMCTSEAEE